MAVQPGPLQLICTNAMASRWVFGFPVCHPSDVKLVLSFLRKTASRPTDPSPLLGSGSLLGSVTAELLLGLGLDGALGLEDGGGTGDGGLTEVGAVASPGDVVGNVLVGPETRQGD